MMEFLGFLLGAWIGAITCMAIFWLVGEVFHRRAERARLEEHRRDWAEVSRLDGMGERIGRE